MKNLKIVFAILTALTMLFSIAFADGNDFSVTADFDGSKVTVNIIAESDNCIIADSGTIQIDYDTDVWEYSTSSSAVDGSFLADNGNNFTWTSPAKTITVNKGDVMATFEFTIKAGAVAEGSSFAFNVNNSYITDDYTGENTYTCNSVTLANIASATDREVEGYTDVVNFSSALTNVTATAPTLTFDLYADGAKHKSYDVSLGDGVTLDNSTLNFKIAIFGAPTDKTITLVNPAVK